VYANQRALVSHNYSPFGGHEFDEQPLQQHPQGSVMSRGRSSQSRQRFRGNGRKRRHNTKNNNPTRTLQRRSRNQMNFEIGDYVQMGNGSVAKVVAYGKRGKSRKIQFKHKVYNNKYAGHYFGPGRFRKWQAELVDEAQYNAVPSDMAFVSPAASPAPSVFSMSPSPSPSRDLKVSTNIRFKEEETAQGKEDDTADATSDDKIDKKIEIRIDTERAQDVMTSPAVRNESDDVEAPSSEVEVDVVSGIDEMEPGQTESPGSTSKGDVDRPVAAVENEQVEGVEDAKETEIEAKAEMLTIFKRPKDTAGVKFEKKLKHLKFGKYKVSNLRERAFLVMCDESKSVDLQSMCDYIAHFGRMKVRKKTAKGFFESMKPNERSLVSFSKFVKVIDENGDVVAAYKRFKTSKKRSRSRKN